jgi:hypothetical protein
LRSLLPLLLGLICLAPVCFTSWPAAAGQFMDGNKLLQLCASGDPYDGLECTGYIKGVADAFAFQMDSQRRPLCMPDGVTARQLVAVTVAWLHDNIPERDYPAVATVGIAIAKKWKCGQ